MPDLSTDRAVTIGETPARAADLLPSLAAAAGRLVPLADGVRLEFPPVAATLRRIGDVVERVSRSCRALDFRLETRTRNGAIALEVTGPAGTRELLARLAGRALPAAG